MSLDGPAETHTPLDQPVRVPPGLPAPLRAAIDAAQHVISQQHALFGQLADRAAHALPPLPQIPGEKVESSLIAPALARIREQENAIDAINTRITTLTTAQARAISSWGTHQIVGIVTDLNHKLDAVTAACHPHPHAHAPAGHGSHPPALPWQIQCRVVDDLDNALSSVCRVVQQAMDNANHVSGQVAHHSHHLRHHSTTVPAAPAAPSVRTDDYHQAAPMAPPTSPLPQDLPTGNTSPLPANLPSG